MGRAHWSISLSVHPSKARKRVLNAKMTTFWMRDRQIWNLPLLIGRQIASKAVSSWTIMAQKSRWNASVVFKGLRTRKYPKTMLRRLLRQIHWCKHGSKEFTQGKCQWITALWETQLWNHLRRQVLSQRLPLLASSKIFRAAKHIQGTIVSLFTRHNTVESSSQCRNFAWMRTTTCQRAWT